LQVGFSCSTIAKLCSTTIRLSADTKHSATTAAVGCAGAQMHSSCRQICC
jgi:hypothetical protein